MGKSEKRCVSVCVCVRERESERERWSVRKKMILHGKMIRV